MTHAPLITRARNRVYRESYIFKGFPLYTSVYLVFSLRFLPNRTLNLSPSSAASDIAIVLAAEELQYAAQAVRRVTGEIGTEDVLDTLFKGFCIGNECVSQWRSEGEGREDSYNTNVDGRDCSSELE